MNTLARALNSITGVTKNLVLVLDTLPDERLCANQRSGMGHWSERSGLVKAEFARAKELLTLAFRELSESIGQLPAWIPYYEEPVEVEFLLRSKSRDADNWAGATKVWLDALCVGTEKRPGLGVLMNDGPRWVRGVSYFLDMSDGEPVMQITIREI